MSTRSRLTRAEWLALAATPEPALIGLWADTVEVHALFAGPVLVSIAVEDGGFPSLAPVRPVAGPFERAVHDLWGHRAEGGDGRPWFQAGEWPVVHPMSARPLPRSGRAEPEDPPAVPEDRHVLVSGPVRPGLREPARLHVVADGPVVVAAEARLGYAHKGTALLMRSKSPRAAARFAARIQADSTVAHSLAFARAAENACGVAPPLRAEALRLLMAAVEAVTASLATTAPQWPGAGQVVDKLRRACAAAFGHRLMMDCVTPGGVLADLRPNGAEALAAALAEVPEAPPVPMAEWARLRHARAAEAAATALDQLPELPPGELSVALPAVSGEGLGYAPTPRGTVWHWLRLDNGTVANAFACDPAWHTWYRFAHGLAGRALMPHDPPFLCVSGADL